MILLDTNAVIWLLVSHPRAATLLAGPERLALSPVSLLELQFLAEVGRIQLAPGHVVESIAVDQRWRVDSPSVRALCEAALPIGWTRDPFDRLLAAHALLRHWPLATGDRRLIAHLGPGATIAL